MPWLSCGDADESSISLALCTAELLRLWNKATPQQERFHAADDRSICVYKSASQLLRRLFRAASARTAPAPCLLACRLGKRAAPDDVRVATAQTFRVGLQDRVCEYHVH